MTAIDPRIERGTRAMLELRRERLAAGDRPLGWKVGFWAPAARSQLGLDRPLVGFLVDGGLIPDGAEVAIGDWATPMLEPEIAAHVAMDIAGDASWDEVRAAIGGLSAAIELADVDPPPEEVETIVAGNIYHRHVMLGPVDTERSTADGITGRLVRDGEQIAATDDPSAAAGELVEVVRLTAELLAACGERLQAGEVVITGSIVPPVPVAPGESLAAELGELGALNVRLR
jgi:2-keto-4-pentenoate hydratase